jgi:hypothetical protein
VLSLYRFGAGYAHQVETKLCRFLFYGLCEIHFKDLLYPNCELKFSEIKEPADYNGQKFIDV